MKKTAVVTGGNKGIGLEITKAFVKAGFIVIVGARTAGDWLDELSQDVVFVPTDVRNRNEVKKLIDVASEITGRIDVLVNNAGFSEWRPIEEIDESFLDNIISTNLKSAFWASQLALPYMFEGSSIVNISSIAGKRGSKNNSAYVATKFAMNGLTQSLAKELGPKGIRVNGLCPVLIPTAGLLSALNSPFSPANGDSIAFIDDFTRQNSALGRLPSAGEVATMCVFLASANAAAVTGQNINTDCGVFPQ